jgi:hypothetical protein
MANMKTSLSFIQFLFKSIKINLSPRNILDIKTKHKLQVNPTQYKSKQRLANEENSILPIQLLPNSILPNSNLFKAIPRNTSDINAKA